MSLLYPLNMRANGFSQILQNKVKFTTVPRGLDAVQDLLDSNVLRWGQFSLVLSNIDQKHYWVSGIRQWVENLLCIQPI